MNKKTILVMTAAMLSLASCSIIRGYRADGKSGPDIYSFEHHVHDTIDNGTFPFRFHTQSNKPSGLTPCISSIKESTTRTPHCRRL